MVTRRAGIGRLLAAGMLAVSGTGGQVARKAQADTFVYDGARRLVRAERGDVVETFRFDGRGNLVGTCARRRAEPPSCKRLVVDDTLPLANVAAEVRRGQVIDHAYGPAGLELVRAGATAPRRVLHDAQGSVIGETNANGALVSRRAYAPEGTARAQAGAFVSAHGYVGELTGPAQLVFLRARHYDPTIGRFLQRDSFAGAPAFPASLNRYAYADGNPFLYQDPSGHFAVPWWFKAAAATKPVVTGPLALPAAVGVLGWLGVARPFMEMREAQWHEAEANAARARAELAYQTARLEALRRKASQPGQGDPSSAGAQPLDLYRRIGTQAALGNGEDAKRGTVPSVDGPADGLPPGGGDVFTIFADDGCRNLDAYETCAMGCWLAGNRRLNRMFGGIMPDLMDVAARGAMSVEGNANAVRYSESYGPMRNQCIDRCNDVYCRGLDPKEVFQWDPPAPPPPSPSAPNEQPPR